MASDLYSRLFRYRSRERRAPLEDFLTEALADFLNRAPAELTRNLVANWLPLSSGRAWSALTGEGASFVWSTQGILPDRRARYDLLLSVDGRPAVVVESKVGSGIRGHSGTAETTLGANQLETYGRWLATERRGETWLGALVLIDYVPQPPAGFFEAAGYGVDNRQAVAWSTVARFIRRALSGQDRELAWVQLGHELLSFMEAHGMPSETLSPRDVAVMQIYADGVHSRLDATILALWDSIRDTAVFRHAGRDDENYSAEGGCFWSWAYLKEPLAEPGGQWFFSFGIRFSDLSQWWNDANLPAGPSLFVALGADARPAFPAEEVALPTGWARSLSSKVVVRSISLNDLDGLELDRMSRWLRSAAEEAEGIVLSARAISGPG